MLHLFFYSIWKSLMLHPFFDSIQELTQRFVDCRDQISSCQAIVVDQELLNWKQSQRKFNWEEDTGRLELNQLQQW